MAEGSIGLYESGAHGESSRQSNLLGCLGS